MHCKYFEKAAMHSNHSRETINKSMPRDFHIMLEETVDLAVRGGGNTTPSEDEPPVPVPKTEGLDSPTKIEQPTPPSSRNPYRISCERHPYTFGHAMFGVSDGESDDDGQDDEPPKPSAYRPPMTRPQKKSKQ
jgi:hypothetical protein